MPDPAAPERTDLIARLRAATDVAETPEDLVEVSVMLLGEAADALEASPEPPVRKPSRWEVAWMETYPAKKTIHHMSLSEEAARSFARYVSAHPRVGEVYITLLYAGEPEVFEPEVGE